MARNRSLDEFGIDAGGESPVVGGPSADADPEPGHDPIAATYRWSPGGASCAACGTVVERRWRDDDGFVCLDCKDW